MATVQSRLQLRLGPADHGRALSLSEFEDATEEPGYRYELARGVLEVTHVPNDPHGEIEWKLFKAFGNYDREHPGLIHRCGAASSIRIWLPGMASGRNPDVAVVMAGAPKDHRGNRIPALAVEVVSQESRDRDYHAKREEYLAYGLFEYWIVDRFERKVTVLVRQGDLWREHVATGDQAIPSQLLPGLAARASDLWENPDDEANQGDLET